MRIERYVLSACLLAVLSCEKAASNNSLHANDPQAVLAAVQKLDCQDAGKLSPELTRQAIQRYRNGQQEACIVGVVYNAKGEPNIRYLLLHGAKVRVLNDSRKNSYVEGDALTIVAAVEVEWGHWDKRTQTFVPGPPPHDRTWIHPNVIGVKYEPEKPFQPLY